MSDQKDDTNPHIPRFTAVQAYQRIKELTSQLDANPDDPAAKDEFDQLMKYVGSNPTIAAEFSRIDKDYKESSSPASEPAKPEKKYVTTASVDFGKARDKVTQGIGVYSTNLRTQSVKSEEKTSNKVMYAAGYALGSISWSWAGEVIDLWSDLLEGYAEKQDDFIGAYRKIIVDRKITGVKSTPNTMIIGALGLRTQHFDVFSWNVAKAALRTDRIGDDLYISWRVFVAEQISWWRIFFWLLACLLAAIFLTVGFNIQAYTQYNPYYYGSSTNPYIQATLETFIKIVIGTGIYLIVFGLFRRNGDWLGMFRRPLDEFDRDDAMAAAHVVHKSVLQAADAIGIDSMKLAPRDTVPSDRRHSSRRI